MPIIKKNEPIGKRPVIILIYGEPGIGKTSLFNTASNPLLIDFDRGVDRSILRQDTLKLQTGRKFNHRRNWVYLKTIRLSVSIPRSLPWMIS